MSAFDDLIPQGGAFDDLVPQKKADPKIGQPEELTFAERHIAPLLNDKAFDLFEKMGFSRGGWAGRLAKGAADPGAAAVQIAANVLPGDSGQRVNEAIAGREREYQDARKAAGSEGFDALRLAGNVGSAALVPVGAGAGVLRGAATGAGFGAAQPVVDGDNFWEGKLAQTATGAATGAVMSPILGALARVVSPKASTDAGLKALRDEGVNPSIGQALGGVASKMEQLGTSLPFMGPMIAKTRRGGIEDFDSAMINRALEPIGERVKGAGVDAVAEAGDKLSAAYQKALSGVNHVNFTTPTFATKLSGLEQMATGLKPDLQPMFTKIIDSVIGTKMSPNGSILGADLKAVDSKLGSLAAQYRGASDPFTRELGDAVLQLKAIVMDEVRTAAPDVARQLKAADQGWAWLTRVENASKKAMNQDGIFTPGQWNQAVREGDRSVRKRKVARGEALGQDIGAEAQRILGNTVPDSGTAARLMQTAAGIAAGGAHLGIPAALIAGSALYTRPVQNTLVRLVANRPRGAPRMANYLRRLQMPATIGAVPLVEDLR